MANVHTGILNTVCGNLHTDEQFNRDLQHVMKLKREGYELTFFRDKYGRLKIKRGGKLWVMAELALLDPFYSSK